MIGQKVIVTFRTWTPNWGEETFKIKGEVIREHENNTHVQVRPSCADVPAGFRGTWINKIFIEVI